MALFSYSDPEGSQENSEGPTTETENEGEAPESGTEDGDLMERLKEDAWVFGWEFDETKGVLRNSAALSRSG